MRDRVRVYSWLGGDDPAEVKDAVAAKVEAGFTAVKMNVGGRMSPLATRAEVGAVLGRINAARDALGLARDFAVDFHGRVSVANAARLLPAAGTVPPALRRGTRAARASRRD